MPTLAPDREISWMTALAHGAPRRRLEAELLPGFLMRQRWYGGKDAGPPEVTLLALQPFAQAGFAAALTLLRVAPPGRTAQTYFLPLATTGGNGAEATAGHVAPAIGDVEYDGRQVQLIDAADDDHFVRALLDAMGRGYRSEELHFRRTAAFPEASALEAAPIERLRAEQSNTSLRIETAMLKLFRRVHAGVHPEIEITGYLTERTSFRHCAALLAAAEWRPAGGEPHVFCALQSAIPNRGDGWSVALHGLEDVAANRESADRRALVALAAQIGRRTAELHRALASPSDDPAFAPEPVTAARLASWGRSVSAQARTALDGLTRAPLDGPAAQLARRVRAAAPALYRRIDTLAAEPVAAWLTRLHNDYHLGQVLVSNGDAYIIDFEGEPLRSLAERRAKHTVLRDVAGMLRSLSYAAAAAARAPPLPTRAQAAVALDACASGMSQAFLETYRRTMGDCPSFPSEPQARRLLELFVLEKALYEVNYELANRPGWVEIPLAGVVTLLEGAPADAGD